MKLYFLAKDVKPENAEQARVLLEKIAAQLDCYPFYRYNTKEL